MRSIERLESKEMDKSMIVTQESIQDKIYTLRGVQVMLDEDLAKLYGVETRVFNQAVKRNIVRFPLRFRFQLTQEEYEDILRSQNVTFKVNLNKDKRGKHRKYLPYVFTEQGVSMLSAVLRSDTAIEISIKIIDTFVHMRKFLAANGSIFQRLDTIEHTLLKHEDNFDKIFSAIENKELKPIQGIFYDGQIFDAYAFVNDFFREAKKEIVLIDNYIDDTVLTLFSKFPKLTFTIVTKSLSKQLKLDIDKYNQQYRNLHIQTSSRYHDRFLLIDKTKAYHLGASLKDLGKKVFAFSEIDIRLLEK